MLITTEDLMALKPYWDQAKREVSGPVHVEWILDKIGEWHSEGCKPYLGPVDEIGTTGGGKLMYAIYALTYPCGEAQIEAADMVLRRLQVNSLKPIDVAQDDTPHVPPPTCLGCPDSPLPGMCYCEYHKTCRRDVRPTDCKVMAAWKSWADEDVEPSVGDVVKRLQDDNLHDSSDMEPTVRRWFHRHDGKTYRGIAVRKRRRDGDLTGT